MPIDKSELLGMHLDAVDRLSRFGPGTIITVLDPSGENSRSMRKGFLTGTLIPLAGEMQTDGIPGTLGVHAEVQDMYLDTQLQEGLAGHTEVTYGRVRVVGHKKPPARRRIPRGNSPTEVSSPGFYTVIR